MYKKTPKLTLYLIVKDRRLKASQGHLFLLLSIQDCTGGATCAIKNGKRTKDIWIGNEEVKLFYSLMT